MIDKSYHRFEPRQWTEPREKRAGGFFNPKPRAFSYRIVDSAFYRGALSMPTERATVYVVSTETLGDCWWSKDHPMRLPVAVYRN